MNKIINQLNRKIIERHANKTIYIKPNINKLYLEMKDDPKYNNKLWKPMTDEETEAYLYKFRNLYKLNDASGRGC